MNAIDVIALSSSGIWPIQTDRDARVTKPGLKLMEIPSSIIGPNIPRPMPYPPGTPGCLEHLGRRTWAILFHHHPASDGARLGSALYSGCARLGVTVGHLYVPVLTFVFGEAQVDGSCATVSTARLREEFYGLPADEVLLRERLLKESIHELGHTFG